MASLTVVSRADEDDPRDAVHSRCVARYGPSKRVRERYVRPDLGVPSWLLRPRQVHVVAMASSLDIFGDVYQAVLDTMPRRKSPFSLVVLGSVMERLVNLGFRNTIERTRDLMDRFGGVHDRVHYLANTFMLDKNGRVLDSALDALLWMRLILDAENTSSALVVVTENPDFQRLAHGKHLQVMNTCDFVVRQGLDDLVEMAQGIRAARNAVEEEMAARKLAGDKDSEIENDTEPWKTPFWTAKEIETKVAASEGFRGKFERNKFHPDEVTIVRPGSLPDVTFNARWVNRAIHNDEVVVKNKRVVAVEKRNWRPYVVTLARDEIDRIHKSAPGSLMTLICVPLDNRIPKIRISTRQANTLVGQRFVVALDDWPLGSRYPQGHYIRTLGAVGNVPAESAAIIVETGLTAHLQDFTPKALACLPSEQSEWRPPEQDIKLRKDLREALIFSVDPPSCQDIDDTMSFETLSDGTVQLGVHIADVTYFLQKASALDAEAQKRATSVYLQDQRLDMLPRLLCEDLCSLRSNLDRFAVSVIWTLDAPSEDDCNLTVRDVWTGRTVIRSAQALSYAQAQRLIDNEDPLYESAPEYAKSHTGKPVSPELIEPLRKALRGLQTCARIRTRQRHRNGALELQGEEFQFGLDDAQQPARITAKRKLEVHDVVAEMMILANEQIAREIVHSDPRVALIRRHAKPPDKKLGNVLELAKDAGIELDTHSNATLAASMARARGIVSPDIFAVLNDGLTRAMSEAEYMCAGEVADISHFGLGLDFYTHFTSPIRRYADVIVHRQLLASKGKCPTDSSIGANAYHSDNSPSISLSKASPNKDKSSLWLAAAERASRDAELLYGGLDDHLADSSKPSDDLLDGLLDGLADANTEHPSADKKAASNPSDLDLDDLLGGLDTEASKSNEATDLDDLLDMGSSSNSADPTDALLDNLLGDANSSQNLHQQQLSHTTTSEEGEKVLEGKFPEQSLSVINNSIQHQAEHINRLHRAAKEASFRSAELFFSLYFQRCPQIDVAVAVSIQEYGVLCYVPKFQSKLLLRFDSSSALTVCRRSSNGTETQTVDEVSFNFQEIPSHQRSINSRPNYGQVNISSIHVKDLPPTSIEVLKPVPVYVCCDSPYENPASRIPKPKLVLFTPESENELDSLLAAERRSSGTQVLKAFARENSPRFVDADVQSRSSSSQSKITRNILTDGITHTKTSRTSGLNQSVQLLSLYGAVEGLLNSSSRVPPLNENVGGAKKNASKKAPTSANVPKPKSGKSVVKPSHDRKVQGKGRISFGGFHSQVVVKPSAEWDQEDQSTEGVHYHGAPESFSRIQKDHKAVDSYVRNVTRDVTRRIEGLAKAKRETKIKKRLKQG